jgi:myo-inositol-1(or 4)-monophosphatase
MAEYLVEQRCAEALSRAAGKMILRASRGDIEAQVKGKNDVVTEVDRSIERFITAELNELFGDDEVLGEEYGGLEGLSEGRRWLIDPIDGTLNFTCGVPLSCVSIALQERGVSQVGVIYDPYRNEMFSARRGHGARLNGAPMAVSRRDEIEQAVLVTGFRPTTPEDMTDNLQNFVNVSKRSRAVRRLGSAALDLAYVAAGRMDGFWEFGLNPWDTGAGYLLVEEAGGLVTDIHRDDYSGFEPSILATNAGIHDSLIELLSA